jgi:hypothetical protein
MDTLLLHFCKNHLYKHSSTSLCSQSLVFILCSPTSPSMESTNERNLFSFFIQLHIVPSGIPCSQNKLAFDFPFLTLSIIFNFFSSCIIFSFGRHHCSTTCFLINGQYTYNVAVFETYRLQQLSGISDHQWSR